jgi:hypothetical protein
LLGPDYPILIDLSIIRISLYILILTCVISSIIIPFRPCFIVRYLRKLVVYFFELFVIGEYLLGYYSRDYNNLSFGGLISYEIINISLNQIKGYPTKITNSINYLGGFGTE